MIVDSAAVEGEGSEDEKTLTAEQQTKTIQRRILLYNCLMRN